MNLQQIRDNLKAPKGQFNAFGKYSYRSCEDILEAVKPLLGDSMLTISDDIVEIGGRVYVKATVLFCDPERFSVTVSAFAREPLERKGMDDSQITGASSSYARKYALNGLFLIDDNKDADITDNRKPAAVPPMQTMTLSVAAKSILDRIGLAESVKEAQSVAAEAATLTETEQKAVKAAYTKRKGELSA